MYVCVREGHVCEGLEGKGVEWGWDGVAVRWTGVNLCVCVCVCAVCVRRGCLCAAGGCEVCLSVER